MGNVTFTYPQGKPNFPRAYIKGFVCAQDCSNAEVTGSILVFDYLYPLYHLELGIDNRFLPPTSNYYTLDYVFDSDNSFAYLNGNPFTASVGIAFFAMTSEPTWRIRVVTALPVDENVTADLEAITNYWRLPV